jgi:hypothetical protein
MGAKLAGHRLETRGELVAEVRVGIAELRAQVADDAAAGGPLPPPDHLRDRIQAAEHPLQWVVGGPRCELILDTVQESAALLHVRPQHRQPQLFLAAEVVEEGAGGHLGRPEDLVQLGRVVALEGEEPRRFADDLLAGGNRSRLGWNTHGTYKPSAWYVCTTTGPERQPKAPAVCGVLKVGGGGQDDLGEPRLASGLRQTTGRFAESRRSRGLPGRGFAHSRRFVRRRQPREHLLGFGSEHGMACFRDSEELLKV